MSFKSICRKLEAEREEVYSNRYESSNGCEVVVNALGTRKGTAPWRIHGFDVVIEDNEGNRATWELGKKGVSTYEPADFGESTTEAQKEAWEEFCSGSPLDAWIDELVKEEEDKEEEARRD